MLKEDTEWVGSLRRKVEVNLGKLQTSRRDHIVGEENGGHEGSFTWESNLQKKKKKKLARPSHLSTAGALCNPHRSQPTHMLCTLGQSPQPSCHLRYRRAPGEKRLPADKAETQATHSRSWPSSMHKAKRGSARCATCVLAREKMAYPRTTAGRQNKTQNRC